MRGRAVRGQYRESVFLSAAHVGCYQSIELPQLDGDAGLVIVKLLTTLVMRNAIQVAVDPDQIVRACTHGTQFGHFITLRGQRCQRGENLCRKLYFLLPKSV